MRLWLSIFILIVSFSCKEAPRVRKPAKVTALVLFKVGSVQAAGREITTGEIIQDHELIAVGAQSILDLQVRETEASITMRLRENTEVTLAGFVDPDGQLNVSPEQSKGTLLTQVQKLGAKERMLVRMPSALASVRGTKFETSIDPGNMARVTVLDGKVAARTRISELEDSSATSQIPELSQLVGALEKSETIIENGKSATLDPKAKDQWIEDSGLGPLLNSPEFKALAGKEAASPEQIESARAASAKHFQSPESQTKLKSSLGRPPAPPTVESLPKEEWDRKLKEYEELVSVEQAKAKDQAAAGPVVKARNDAIQAQLLSRIEQIMGKASETLLLKNGTRIRGVIYQNGADYLVLTAEGSKTFSDAEVSGIEF